MGSLPPLETVIALLALAGTLTVMLRRGWRAMRTLDRIAVLLLGDDTRPGLEVRLTTLEERTRELIPNSGGSIKDQVRTLSRDVGLLRQDQLEMHERTAVNETLANEQLSGFRVTLGGLEMQVAALTGVPAPAGVPAMRRRPRR